MTDISRKKQKVIKEILERVIYLQPQIFKVIAGLGLAVPYDADKDEHMDYYHIFTKYPHTNKKGLKEFAVNLKIGEAIKVLIKNSPQYMFPKIREAPFDRKNSVLTINRISLDIPRDTGMHQLCILLFGNKSKLNKKWNFEELAEKMHVEGTDYKKQYHYLYDQIGFLNTKIKDATELDEFLQISKKTLLINPLYSSTFLD